MRALVAHSSAAYREALSKLLQRWQYEVVLAEDGEQAKTILQADNPPLLAILDESLPKLSAVHLCRLIREDTRHYIYAIVLGNQPAKDGFVTGFVEDADEFVTRPLVASDLVNLRNRLSVGERIVKAFQHLREASEEFYFQATHDNLTQTWSRKAVLDHVDTELWRAKRLDTTFSICLCDIDSFKNINDTYGHPFGDAVLRNCALRMTRCLRAYDSLGRYGGDEFLVVLPECDGYSAALLAERLRFAIASDGIRHQTRSANVTISIGVCEWQTGLEPAHFLDKADKALYHAKKAGRNRIYLYSSGELTEIIEHKSAMGTVRK
jgi:diguanylate cyclase (GGDEF)-like protein